MAGADQHQWVHSRHAAVYTQYDRSHTRHVSRNHRCRPRRFLDGQRARAGRVAHQSPCDRRPRGAHYDHGERARPRRLYRDDRRHPEPHLLDRRQHPVYGDCRRESRGPAQRRGVELHGGWRHLPRGDGEGRADRSDVLRGRLPRHAPADRRPHGQGEHHRRVARPQWLYRDREWRPEPHHREWPKHDVHARRGDVHRAARRRGDKLHSGRRLVPHRHRDGQSDDD